MTFSKVSDRFAAQVSLGCMWGLAGVDVDGNERRFSLMSGKRNKVTLTPYHSAGLLPLDQESYSSESDLYASSKPLANLFRQALGASHTSIREEALWHRLQVFDAEGLSGLKAMEEDLQMCYEAIFKAYMSCLDLAIQTPSKKSKQFDLRRKKNFRFSVSPTYFRFSYRNPRDPGAKKSTTGFLHFMPSPVDRNVFQVRLEAPLVQGLNEYLIRQEQIAQAKELIKLSHGFSIQDVVDGTAYTSV